MDVFFSLPLSFSEAHPEAFVGIQNLVPPQFFHFSTLNARILNLVG